MTALTIEEANKKLHGHSIVEDPDGTFHVYHPKGSWAGSGFTEGLNQKVVDYFNAKLSVELSLSDEERAAFEEKERKEQLEQQKHLDARATIAEPERVLVVDACKNPIAWATVERGAKEIEIAKGQTKELYPFGIECYKLTRAKKAIDKDENKLLPDLNAYTEFNSVYYMF